MASFDTIPVRRGSGSVKWDETPPAPSPSDLIPLWVADMDFETAPCVRKAVLERAMHGVYGYTHVPDSYYEALTGWFASRHGWTFPRESVIYTSGVVPAVSATLKALTSEGDEVVVLTPVYNCFFSSIRNVGCKASECALLIESLPDGTFTYRIDFEDLERRLESARVLLLCNPHNPACRVWKREELEKVAALSARYGVQVVSDEIHNELVMPGYRYLPFACVQPSCISLVSPSKSFNTAGLQIANIVCQDPDLRARIDKVINIFEICDVNPFGVAALEAAYSPEGAAWLGDLCAYIWDNYLYLKEVFARELPSLPLARLEGTYLAWVDCRSLPLSSSSIEEKLLSEGVWVNAGGLYHGEGFIRINLATSRELLARGLERAVRGLKSLES